VVLTPGLVVQLALFSSSFAGFGLLADIRTGVLERLRVTPVRRTALLLGKVMANALMTVVQAILLVAMAYLVFGLDAPLGGVALSLLIAGVTAVSLASASYAIALRLRSEQAFPALLNAVMLPLVLLSGMLLPITTGLAPKWLYALSRVNPFSHIVDAERASFRGDFAPHTLLAGSIVLIVLTVVTVWWGARTFLKENA
jgi:ABC-2 type transport system permease protein